ncbi:helix-turn-helix transcriptional regulator [Streptomyces roseirectus]|uniref:Helix-turn-helix transcriptional regulator n=1 Tax=Streptomyces roseirectus TaxID=2768066 RepID=A0A7H0IMJ8_9ACTN|nr:helix-turn-helix transcriptional regulator [Streptomyces roseirectus]QNP74014.1 helix-turn-helix transcriptional regulator [Streptomyces roseirectus]
MVTPVTPPTLDRTSPPPRPAAAPTEGVRARIRARAHGDLLAAAEIAARLTDRQAAGLDPLPTEPADLAPALLRARRREVRALPDDTRLLLLLAAADQHPLPTRAFLRAVAAAGLDTRPLDAAETAGVASAGPDGVTFRDPWIRVAAYETATPADRRDAHRLLARVLDGRAEAPHRAWHRGAGALGPSGRLAGELASAAAHARVAGAPALARALTERAASLATDPAAGTRLLARAAADAFESGDADHARLLAARTTAGPLTGVLALRTGNAGEAFDAVLAGVTQRAGTFLRDGAPHNGAPHSGAPHEDIPHLLARATEAAVYTGDLRRCREALAQARRAGIDPPGVLPGLAAAVDGRYGDARDLLQAAAGHCGPGGDPTLLVHAGIAALLLGDHTRAATATLRAAEAARARGAAGTVVQAREFRVYADFWTGRPRAAETAALEALREAYTTGQDNAACHLQAALAMFAALTGDADLCRERAATARAHALAHGLGLPAALAQWALAVLDLGTGRFDAVAARLRALAGFGPGHGHRAIRHLATPAYVEAAVRTGDTGVAKTAHADYDRWARTVRSADDLALSARCRALLTPGAAAVDHYRAALDLHAGGTRDVERAHTELLFGSALRRLRRRTEARDRLHSALEAFTSFGAPHFADLARAELRALGAPAAPLRASAAPEGPQSSLTAQQLLVARMAADGATNREIAARLALSPRTIDHHLRGVFTRLGIRSRIELVRILAETP